ncbi:DNA helicase [Tanacetum coccineum]
MVEIHEKIVNSGVSNNGSSASRQGRNVQVRPQLNSVVGGRSTSRRTGHHVLTSGSTVDTTNVASAGTSYTYSDLGDCDRRCRYCGASFWYVERLKRHLHNQTHEYHLCCGGGRIQMQPPREPTEYIKILFQNKHFMENIRAYNQMFAMTSFGAKIDESINAGRGSYVFKVSGQIYYWIGSLCPPEGEVPRFLQLYIYDTNNEVQNRMHHFGGIDNTRDKFRELDIPEFKIRLYNAQGARGYELPTSNTLGAMVFESGISNNADFDFPLLFIYGQPGYHTKLILKSANGVGRGKRVTMLAYYIYQLHFRLQQYDLLFREGLFVFGCNFQGWCEMVMEVGEELSFLCLLQALSYLNQDGSQKGDLMFCFRADDTVPVGEMVRWKVRVNESYVVPYNLDLLIKYLFKYISKGTYRIFARVSRPIGESSTAATSSRRFDIHCHEPAVQILAVHLEDIQRTTFRDQDKLKSVIDLPGKKSTTLTEWFAFNEANEVGRHLSLFRCPSEFVMEVQTVNGVFYPTYRAACQALGLIGDDKEWEITFEEARGSATPEEPWFLFSHILLYCDVAEEISIGPCLQSLHVKAKHGLGQGTDISLEERSLVNSFASWLLDIGDGKVGEPAYEDHENNLWVQSLLICFLPD